MAQQEEQRGDSGVLSTGCELIHRPMPLPLTVSGPGGLQVLNNQGRFGTLELIPTSMECSPEQQV